MRSTLGNNLRVDLFMFELMRVWLNAHLNEIGSYASVIGLGVTMWVAFSLKTLSKRAAFRGRLPDYIRDARTTSSDLTSILNSEVLDVDSVETTLRTCLSSVASLRRKAPGELRARVKSLYKQSHKLTKKRGNITRDSVREVYNEVSSFEADLKNYQKDEKWRIEK